MCGLLARQDAMQAEILVAAAERQLRHALRRLELAGASVTERQVCQLALDDAHMLGERCHSLRRRLEQSQGRDAAA